jgi:hypothetical protein
LLLVPDSCHGSEIDGEEASVHNSGTTPNENGVVEEIYDSAVPESPSPTGNLSPFNEAGISRINWSTFQDTPRRSSAAERKARIELAY